MHVLSLGLPTNGELLETEVNMYVAIGSLILNSRQQNAKLEREGDGDCGRQREMENIHSCAGVKLLLLLLFVYGWWCCCRTLPHTHTHSQMSGIYFKYKVILFFIKQLCIHTHILYLFILISLGVCIFAVASRFSCIVVIVARGWCYCGLTVAVDSYASILLHIPV